MLARVPNKDARSRPAAPWRAAALVLLLACSKGNGAPTASSEAGAHPTRIVSISPSTTEAVFAIGAGPSLVGRSRYCDYPPEVLKLPQVGGFVDPNLEAILALKPDLVVGARGPAGQSLVDQLGARGIATYFPPTETFADIETMIAGLGEKTALPQGAKTSLDGLHAHLASTEARVAKLPHPRVLLVFGLAPIAVAGPGSFADEMLRRAGGVNVVTAGGAYPTIGSERVLALDPDVVINAAMMEERAAERLNANAPGWGAVRAVKEGHVATLTDEAVLRPGPRIADGLEVLAKAIHPELAK